ncbi:MAG: NAD-dependent epimerase/dehydratase family protein [Alphaproteobacteria bacterium]|nr:NAD-dependent epimerase/dehydratase family protein [Alphaproteobacteria bacterium]
MVILRTRSLHRIENLLRNYDKHHCPLWVNNKKNEIDEIIIFGAYGQVGVAVIRLALFLGIKVCAVQHKRAVSFSHSSFRQVKKKDLKDLFSQGKKKVVFTGPINKIRDYEEILGKIDHIICFSSTSKFTKSSSKSKFYKNIVQNFDEGEKYIEESASKLGFKFNIIRPTLIYGFGIDSNISSIVKFIKKYKVLPIYKSGSGLRQPVHVEDLANSVISLLNSGSKSANKSYNLSGGESLTYYKMVERVFETLDRYPIIVGTRFLPILMDIGGKLVRSKVVHKEVALNMEKDFVFSHKDATKDFNYSPRGFLDNGIMDISPIN